MAKKRGFTLIELLIVVIIISIAATIAVTHYASIRERVLDREAMANLKLLQGQERTYKVEMGTYYPSSGSDSIITTINQNLVITLPTGSDRSWNYTVKNTGCVQATRNGSDSRSWYLAVDNNSFPLVGTCP